MLIDPTDPARPAVSVLVEQPGNGGVSTAYKLEGYRTMSVEAFKEHIVPTLKSTEASGKFSYYVLRDLSNNRIFSIYPDGVIEYKVDCLYEVPSDDVIKKLLETTDTRSKIKTYVINSSMPIWSYGENEVYWEMAVKVPETRFQFKHPQMFKDGQFPWIYLPPCKYTVKGHSSSNTVAETRIEIITMDSVAPKNCKFAHLPLPNIYGDGRICTGSTHLTENYDPKSWSKYQVVMTAFDLLIGTNWNYDLMGYAQFPDNLDEVLEENYPGLKVPEDIVGLRDNIDKLWKLVMLLRKEGVWESLNWVPM